MSEPIVRIAARGEGISASGAFVPLAAPGDMLLPDGSIKPGPHHQVPPCRHFPECGGCQLQHVSIEPGPHHQVPPCRHFPECGGCQLQHVDDSAYREYLVERVTGALAQHGLSADIRDPHLSPPRSRRRAALRALRVGNGVALGFNEARSTRIVDMRECHILRPELFALVAPLRILLATMLRAKRVAEVQLTLTDQGVDVALAGVQAEGLEAAEALSAFGDQQRLARLSLDEGYGSEVRFEPIPATVTLSGIPVALPPGAFLQATEDGEAALVAAVREAVEGAPRIADLFAGLGTFAFALPGQVTAVEAARDAILALKMAAMRSGRPVTAEHRDLYRRPLDPAELGAFDAVALDPPRAGAHEQVIRLAASAVPRIAYVSCNPATFARDAALLVAGGYRLDWVRPVGQFRWSTHIELAAAFTR